MAKGNSEKWDKQWIQVGTTRNQPTKFFPLQPKAEDIHIVDIAHALSNICRFTGHVKNFYSVAEHCVRVSWRASEVILGYGEELTTLSAAWIAGAQGLLHDASEAYLADIASPVKHQEAFAPYRAAEDVLQKLIFKTFALPENMAPEVKQADLDLLWTEARDLLTPLHPDWPIGEPLVNQTIVGWTPRQAEKLFLQRFEEFYDVSDRPR